MAVAATAIQFVIWLLIVLVTWELTRPWWMWTLLAAGVLAGIERLTGSRDVAPHQAEADAWDAR